MANMRNCKNSFLLPKLWSYTNNEPTGCICAVATGHAICLSRLSSLLEAARKKENLLGPAEMAGAVAPMVRRRRNKQEILIETIIELVFRALWLGLVLIWRGLFALAQFLKDLIERKRQK